jgi:hypothetical protein
MIGTPTGRVPYRRFCAHEDSSAAAHSAIQIARYRAAWLERERTVEPSPVNGEGWRVSDKLSKGAPSTRQARAGPAQRDRELKTRGAGEEFMVECERDHLVLSGEGRGSALRPRASVCRAGALWAQHRRRATGPASLGKWLLAVARSPAPR